jgi:hypothetical protein
VVAVAVDHMIHLITEQVVVAVQEVSEKLKTQ